MNYSDEHYNLRIDLDTKHCSCSAEEIRKMEKILEPLHQLTLDFPVSDLYVTVIHHARTGDYHVKTALVLCGRTLFTGERHHVMYTAYQQCIDKLTRKVVAYKNHLRGEEEHGKHAHEYAQRVSPAEMPSHERIQQAVESGDYFSFRKEMDVYEESLNKRIGRWVQRFPDLNAIIGEGLNIEDIVEDVFLTAFDQFEEKPFNVAYSEWLENLIETCVQDIMDHPEEELRNVEMAQSALDAEAKSKRQSGD